MVHRTDIAGWVGCSMGQSEPRRWQHVPSTERRPDRKIHLPEPPPVFCVGGNTRCRLFMTAVPSVHAIHAEALGR
jgi:hypothetical protein